MLGSKQITKLGRTWLVEELRLRQEKAKAFIGRDRSAGRANGSDITQAGVLDNCEYEERANAQRVQCIVDDLSGEPEFINLPTQTKVAAIGHIVTVELDDGETSKITRIMLDGYSEDLGADFTVVNVRTSPLGQVVFGLQVDDCASYTVRGRNITATVNSIELPSQGDLRVFRGTCTRRPMATAA